MIEILTSIAAILSTAWAIWEHWFSPKAKVYNIEKDIAKVEELLMEAIERGDTDDHNRFRAELERLHRKKHTVAARTKG